MIIPTTIATSTNSIVEAETNESLSKTKYRRKYEVKTEKTWRISWLGIGKP